jgi:DNA polymerase-3 subunit gamma/tau
LQQTTDDSVVLALDAACVHLRGAEREAALKSAIETWLGRTIRIRIEVAEAATETPARQRTRDEQARQQAAEAAIANDPNVQRISEVFGAAVRPGSIRPRVPAETDPVN